MRVDHIIKEGSFIEAWINMANIRKYECVGHYPDGETVPPGHFNLWTGFNVEKLIIADIRRKREEEYEKRVKEGDTEAELDESEIDILQDTGYLNDDSLRNECSRLTRNFHNHMRFICNNDEKSYEYLLNWIAHIFCFPARKCGTAVLIKSLVGGVGKNRITDFVRYLMDGFGRADEDSGYSFDTEEFKDEVMGKFNHKMLNKFLVVIDEPNKSECFEKAEQFKKIITGPTFQCEKKGVDTVTKRSYHRFIITSNEGIPIKIDKGDRRYCVIECNATTRKEAKYFIDLSKELEDPDVQKAFYLELLAMKDKVKDYDWISNIPENSIRQDIKDASIKPEAHFVIDEIQTAIREDPSMTSFKMSTKSLYSLFQSSVHKPSNYNPTMINFTITIKGIFKEDWIEHKNVRIEGAVQKAIVVDVAKFLEQNPLPVVDDDDEPAPRLIRSGEAGPSNAILDDDMASAPIKTTYSKRIPARKTGSRS